MKKEVYATVSPNAPITSMPKKKKKSKKAEEKMVAGVSQRSQWVSLPPHRALREPVAGYCCLTHPTCSVQSPKPEAFCTK